MLICGVSQVLQQHAFMAARLLSQPVSLFAIYVEIRGL